MAEVQGAPAPQEGGASGGGITEVLQQLDAGLYKVATTLAQSQGAPEEAKAAFQAASQAFRQGIEILTGGGQGQAPQQTTTPEQGGNPNAVPVSHGRPQ